MTVSTEQKPVTTSMSPPEPEELPLFGGERLGHLHNLVYCAILAAMVLIPEMHWFKYDVLHGRYFVLGEEMFGRDAKIAFLVVFLTVNVVIFTQNYLFGRLVCGWVCPVGYLSRLSRDLKQKWMRRRKERPLLFYPTALIASMVFGLICLNWVFVDMWTVFRPEDPYFQHALVLAGLFGGSTYIVVGHVDFAFCRSLCPSGAYFTLLSQSWAIDLHFENPDQCIDCDACIRICPTDLDPRHRDQPIENLKAKWDLYPDDYKHSASRCFLCGDCIEACDQIFENLNKKKQVAEGVPKIGLLRFRAKHNPDPSTTGG
jgi:ferredoxin-type protein NapH